MPGREQSNAVRAGVFVLLSVLLAVVIIVILSGVVERIKPANAYVVRFPLSVGAQGLNEGSEVRVGGQKVGQVSSVGFSPNGEDAGSVTPTWVDVRVRIRRDLRLREGAVAQLEVPLLGSTSVLNFPTLGNPDAPPIDRGGQVRGRLAAPAFLASAGYGVEQSNQMQDILKGMNDIVTRVNDGILPEMESMVGRVGDRSETWLENIDVTTQNARDLVASLRSLVDENRASIDATIANSEAASASARSVTAKADEVATRLQDELVDAAIEMMENGRDAATEARATINRVDSLVAETTPNARIAMANMRLTADQFKLAAMEIRRAPWRLLHRPDTKELEYELLYDAARSYATAVSDLRGAAASLESAMSRRDGGAPGDDHGTIEELTRLLGSNFEDYQRAEEKFLELLLEKARQ